MPGRVAHRQRHRGAARGVAGRGAEAGEETMEEVLMGKIMPSTCSHDLWELIEDSGYWMFRCIYCGLCHELIDISDDLKKKVSKRDKMTHNLIVELVQKRR